MRQLFLTIIIAWIGPMAAFSQTGSLQIGKDSIAEKQEFYFPAVYYKDSIALARAMPKLAEQVLKVYHEENKRTFYENSIYYNLLSDNYSKAIDLIDSIRKIDDERSYGIDMKSYALARIADKKQPGSFNNIFKKEYSEAFSQLSFRKKVNAALADTSYVNYFDKDLTSVKEKLSKSDKDSLNLEDSRSLCEKFFYCVFYRKTVPLTLSLIDAKYRSTFPAIKGAKWAGVVPVQPIDEKPDPNVQYKLLFELTGFALKGQDSSAKTEINLGLSEIARQINLHEANGIPRKNIHIVIVAHATALYCFLKNEKYKKKYGVDNPNISLIKELQAYGVKMLVCGQAMTFLNLEMEDLVPGLKQALTAQTVISSYQLKGYVYYDMSLRE